MSKISTRIAVAVITIFASVLVHAQALQAIGTLKRGKARECQNILQRNAA